MMVGRSFINTFDEIILQLMYHNSYNPKLAAISKRLDTSSGTYISLAQSDFQRPCNKSRLTTEVARPDLKLYRP